MIELLVVMAIAAILLAVGIPSFRPLLNSMRLSTAASTLIADLSRARSEAIKRNSRMLMCVRNSAGTDCAIGAGWAGGWIVCYDDETNSSPGNGIADGLCDAPPGDGSRPNPVLSRAAASGGMTITASDTKVRFSPNGTATPLSLVLQPIDAPVTRTVVVAATGNISRK